MSEPIPESIPTSQDPRSKRPLKRRALTPVSEQATQIQSLFKDPSKEIRLPSVSKPRTAASLPPPPEIIANVQGSSAGAGSGEFHVYKASRRREYERQRLMDDELKGEQADEEFNRRMEEAKKKDDEKTERNRRKREKRKAGKGKNKNAAETAKAPVADGSGSRADSKMSTNVTDNGHGGPNGDQGVIIHEDD